MGFPLLAVQVSPKCRKPFSWLQLELPQVPCPLGSKRSRTPGAGGRNGRGDYVGRSGYDGLIEKIANKAAEIASEKAISALMACNDEKWDKRIRTLVSEQDENYDKRFTVLEQQRTEDKTANEKAWDEAPMHLHLEVAIIPLILVATSSQARSS